MITTREHAGRLSSRLLRRDKPCYRKEVKLQHITASHLNLFGDTSNGKEITVTIKLYTAKRKKIT